MAVDFDPQTGLSAQDTETIRAEVVAAWQTVFDDKDATLNTAPESPAGQIIDSIVALITGKDSEFLMLANQFNPKTASGRFQDMLALIYFITRKLAEPTVVTCQCVGLQGTVIPQGAIIQNTDGYRLASSGEATIPEGGTVNVEFALEQSGPIAIGANTCTTIVTVIPGWDTVNNAVAGVPGRLEESRAEFEARRYASVANNAHGSVAAVYGTLANINGVLDLQVLENRGDTPIVEWGVTIPGHSVAICIYGGADDDIAEGIYNKLGNGCGTDDRRNYRQLHDLGGGGLRVRDSAPDAAERGGAGNYTRDGAHARNHRSGSQDSHRKRFLRERRKQRKYACRIGTDALRLALLRRGYQDGRSR